MKSGVEYKGDVSNFIDMPSRGAITGILKEWEEFTGNSGNFVVQVRNSVRGERTVEVQSDFSTKGDHPYIQFRGNKLVLYFLESHSGRGKGFFILGGWTKREFNITAELRSSKGIVCGNLRHTDGVEDLLDIQPYEYGLLKLKYDIPKDNLFLPSYVKNILLEN